MKLYDSNYGKFCLGDCLEIMKDLPDNSIDTLITDPPAGISFMSKAWDSHRGGRDKWIIWAAERFAEALRILKPGGLAFVWALPRTAHWPATALENAGFMIINKNYFLFGAGWPKGLDISKGIDRHFGCIREKIEDPEKIKNTPTKENKLFQGHNNDGFIRPSPVHPLAQLWNGWNSQLKPMAEEWIIAMKSTEKVYWHELRELTGNSHWIIQVVLDKPKQKEKYRIDPEEKSAVLFQYKPLAESESFFNQIFINGNPIGQPFNVRPFKPWHSKGIVENALKWGVGGYNIDKCRIPVDKENEPRRHDLEPAKQDVTKTAGVMSGYNTSMPRYLARSIQNAFQKGRYPGNVVIDDEMAKELDERYGERKTSKLKAGLRNKTESFFKSFGHYKEYEAASGGASRFFTRCNWEPTDFFFSGKARQSEKTKGLQEKCEHPTVKPLQLMRWLAKLSIPPGPAYSSTVLDIFAGTATTGIAAFLEGRKFILIEKESKYFEIGVARLKDAMGLFGKEVKK